MILKTSHSSSSTIIVTSTRCISKVLLNTSSRGERVKGINTRRGRLALHLTRRNAHIVETHRGVRMKDLMEMSQEMMIHHLAAILGTLATSNIRLVPT